MTPQTSNCLQGGPLSQILKEAEDAFNAGLYYASITICLTLPDICSALEFEPGHSRFRKIEKRYKDWFDTYAAPKFNQMNRDDCWAMRGGVVHNAMLSQHPQNMRGKIIMMPPNNLNIVINEMVALNAGPEKQDALQVNIEFFCRNMVQAAIDWWEAKCDDPTVQTNAPDLLRLRPQGLAPFIVGLPVIA